MTTAPEAAQYRLLIFGAGSVRTVPLHGTRWTIGRGQDCSIQLRDPTVSRKHLLLERIGDEFHFSDLGSANPAQLDGKPTRQGTLAVGQALTIGLTRILLEQRRRPSPVQADPTQTVVLSREVIDEELPSATPASSFPSTAARVLERIEWTFADLGDLVDAAEPMLDLALNLTSWSSGWIARFNDQGNAEVLATLTHGGNAMPLRLPDSALEDARRIGQPHILSTREDGQEKARLLVPLGEQSRGILVLEDPAPQAPKGQELLRLARSLGAVVWHRLQETLERSRLRSELERLRFHGTTAHNALLTSTRLQDVRTQLRAIAGSDQPLLLLGEPGTEREDLARYMHSESPRRSEPFLAWDASRVPAARQLAELFGEAGRPGMLDRAAGGTLFLDHPSSLSSEAQRRLAELLAGTSRASPRPRLVISSDHEPPPSTTDRGSWSDDLRACLAAEPIRIPPLREDPRDVLALAELLLSELGNGPDGSPRLMTERTKRALTNYPWPGNVRELRLVLETAAANAGTQPIAPRHLPQRLLQDPVDEENQTLPTLEQVEREHIAAVMRATGGVRSRAAQILGIANSTLYEKLKRYEID